MNLANQRRVFSLALPIMLSNATVPLVGIVDTAVMGRMASPAYLSAVAVGAVLFSSIFWVFGFLKMGTGGLVAQASGRDDHTELHSGTAVINRLVVDGRLRRISCAYRGLLLHPDLRRTSDLNDLCSRWGIDRPTTHARCVLAAADSKFTERSA